MWTKSDDERLKPGELVVWLVAGVGVGVGDATGFVVMLGVSESA
jgi:hypothetical protein